MTTEKIKNEEIASLRISSLPSRPNASGAFGGRGYTAAEMKAAFDRLPLFLVERFNSLIDDIGASGDGSLADAVPTGLGEGHTLADLFADIPSGALAGYLCAGEETLAKRLDRIDGEIEDATSYEHMKAMPTGLRDSHTLATFFTDIKNGALAQYLVTTRGVLDPKIAAMDDDLTALKTAFRDKTMFTGIKNGHTLGQLFLDIKSGAFADYLETDGGNLEKRLSGIEKSVTEAKSGIDGVKSEVSANLAETGIKENYTISDFFSDVKDGDILAVIPYSGGSLSTKLDEIVAKIADLSEKPGFSASTYQTGVTADQTLDGFFSSLKDGTFFDTVGFEGKTLGAYLRALAAWHASLTGGGVDLNIDFGSPADRPTTLS